MTRETRQRLAEIRAVDIAGQPGVTLHAIRPGVVDDYGSLWSADAFDASLGVRLPVLCWSHDWTDPLGPAVGYRTGPEGPEVDFVFSDFAAVPQARRAHAQVTDGTIVDCSVGFSNTRRRDPSPEEQAMYPGVREVILSADLDEISLVMRGAVPGAKVIAVRSVGAQVSEDAWLTVARKVAAGELSVPEGKAALALAAEETPEDPPPDPAPEVEPEPDPAVEEEFAGLDPDVLDEIAQAEAVLAERSH